MSPRHPGRLSGDAVGPPPSARPSEDPMQINPYLSFDGRCREAFTFYAEVLGGEVDFVDHNGVPEGEADPAWGAMILHAQLAAGDQVLMGADMPPGAGDGAGSAPHG